MTLSSFKRKLIMNGAGLITDSASSDNPEYDRAIVELVSVMLDLKPEDYPTVEVILRDIKH